jgi:hypothetical protein
VLITADIRPSYIVSTCTRDQNTKFSQNPDFNLLLILYLEYFVSTMTENTKTDNMTNSILVPLREDGVSNEISFEHTSKKRKGKVVPVL